MVSFIARFELSCLFARSLVVVVVVVVRTVTTPASASFLRFFFSFDFASSFAAFTLSHISFRFTLFLMSLGCSFMSWYC